MKHRSHEDLCPAPTLAPPPPNLPLAPPIYPASVYQCHSTDEARQLLGSDDGIVYQRDGHPNAIQLAGKCRQLHQADFALMTGSGMSGLAAILLSSLQTGDHVVASAQLYGRSLQLINQETRRLGITCSVVDTNDLDAVRHAIQENTRLLVVETISNPLLRVADIRGLAQLAHERKAELLVDNTFASPLICQPLSLGADWVLESVSKIINGHSDVMLGLVAGRDPAGTGRASRLRDVLSAWGLASSPFECWLALRGLTTLHLRLDRAATNAMAIAQFLAVHPAIRDVHYPGLVSHPDHELAHSQFEDRFGWMVTFDLEGGVEAANHFITAAQSDIPFCPSLGEVSTTLSHPASTSQRNHSPEQLAALGIGPETIRLSVGTESIEHLLAVLAHLCER